MIGGHEPVTSAADRALADQLCAELMLLIGGKPLREVVALLAGINAAMSALTAADQAEAEAEPTRVH